MKVAKDRRTGSAASMTTFVKTGSFLVNVDRIDWVSFCDIELLQAEARCGTTEFQFTGMDAIELAMALKPSVLENRRMRWIKFMWSFHNLVGHPVMQVLAFFGLYKLAFKVHDATVPKPKGVL